MSFSSFFKKIGHGISHAAHEVAHDVESAAKNVAKGVEGVVEHGAGAIDDALHGDFKDALKQMGKAGQSVADTVKAEARLALTAGTAMVDLTLGSLADAHLSKGLTKLAQCAKGVVDHTRDGLDQTVNQFVDSSEGVVSGGLRCAGDVVHGHFDRLGKDGLSVAGDALNVGMCLTPEGVAESVGANVASSVLHGTPLAQFSAVAGDALARKPMQMLKDTASTVAEDVAAPVVDPLLQRAAAGRSSAVSPRADAGEQAGTGAQATGDSAPLLAALAPGGGASIAGGASGYSVLTAADDDSGQEGHVGLEVLAGVASLSVAGGGSAALHRA
ncbi:hypothetical protein [Xanthomonas theicola]|nr:hypothetical protein [Xanthomonas theicola]QNH23695.1 hypothetical protein G4Q83_01405 [Xanthomonas theicola]